MRDRRSPAQVLSELRLPRPEREAARAERQAEREIRRERENQHSADRRAARLAAEARRTQNADRAIFGPSSDGDRGNKQR